MSVYPRHTTLTPEERALVGTAPSQMLTTLEVTVPYPDGTNGLAHYERLGPGYHRLTYRYQDNTLLARIPVYAPIENTHKAIGEALRSHAEQSFKEAMRHEQQDVFARATFPAGGGRDVDRNKATFDADKAKRIGGKYAVCLRLTSGKLIAISRVYDTIAEANARFQAEPNLSHVVACASRLDRRWMVPKYNPLHATADFRKEAQNG